MSGRDPRPFKCPHPGCNWTFSRQEHQTRHLRTHSGERPYQCYYTNCPSRFARNDELKRHVRLVHEYDRDTPSHEAALADIDHVVYNGHSVHSRKLSEQLPSPAHSGSSSSYYNNGDRYAEQQGSSSSPRTQLPPRPVTSMSHYQSGSYARQTPPPPPLPSTRRPFAQPSPLNPTAGPSFLSRPPITTMHPPLPLHYRPPALAGTPVQLPPLNSDGYATDSGRRERRVQLPGFSEIAGQQRHDSSHSRRY